MWGQARYEGRPGPAVSCPLGVPACWTMMDGPGGRVMGAATRADGPRGGRGAGLRGRARRGPRRRRGGPGGASGDRWRARTELDVSGTMKKTGPGWVAGRTDPGLLVRVAGTSAAHNGGPHYGGRVIARGAAAEGGNGRRGGAASRRNKGGADRPRPNERLELGYPERPAGGQRRDGSERAGRVARR